RDPRRARGRAGPVATRRQADGPAPHAEGNGRGCDRHRLPHRDPRPRRDRAPGRYPRRRDGPARAGHGRLDQARRRRDRRRHPQARRRHPLRRRRFRRRFAGRFSDHPGTRRGRPHDRRPAAAKHPPGRSSLEGTEAMIKLGICNELFEGWDFAQVCRTVKEIGYDGLEIAPFTLAPRIDALSPEKRQDLKAMVEDAGLETIGLHWLLAKTEGFYLTSPDAAVRRSTIDYLKALAEATRDLGGSLMVLGSPKQPDLLPGVTYDQAATYAIEGFDGVLPALDAAGVDLCPEPLAPSETNFLNTCAQAMALIDRVGHPRLRLHMDVKAQSSETGTTVPGLIRRHAPQAGHFHAQDVNLR